MRVLLVAMVLAGPAQSSPPNPRDLATAGAVDVAGDLARLPSGKIVSLSRNQMLREWGELIRLQGDGERGCGVGSDGGVRCWARDAADKIVVKVIDGLGKVKDAAGSLVEGCAAQTDGSVICWQRDDPAKGEAGLSSDEPARTPNFDTPSPPPLSRPVQIVPLSGLTDAVAVAGGRQGCALRRSGAVACWGRRWARTGKRSPLVYDSAPRDVPGIRGATQIADNGNTRCAIAREGEIWCWGRKLVISPATTAGILDSPFDEKPRMVPGIKNAVALSLHVTGTGCAVTKSGRVTCWGMRSCPMDGVGDAVSVSVSSAGACAARRGGGLACLPCSRAVR